MLWRKICLTGGDTTSLIFLMTTIAQVEPSYGQKLHEHLQQTQP